MTVITLAAAVVASLQATGQVGQGLVVSASEPLLIAVWGLTLFVLATRARNLFSAPRTESVVRR